MIKRIIGRFFRWTRRAYLYLCSIDNDPAADGLADILIREPMTDEEKAARFKEWFLASVEPEKRGEVWKRFISFQHEHDPMDNIDHLLDGDIIAIEADIPTGGYMNRGEK